LSSNKYEIIQKIYLRYKKSRRLKKGNMTISMKQLFHNDLITKLGLKASMSRRGQCVDNAPIESFFWYMKDEVNFDMLQTL